MPADDDADDDTAGAGPPLPPDDRLWRHPSEVASWGTGGERPLPATPAPARGGVWSTAVVAALAGAALCGGVLAVTGVLSAGDGRFIVEKVAVTPVVSSPLTSGERGVAVLADKVGPSVVRLLVTTRNGATAASGVVFRDDGLLYTSAHEVEGAEAITVVLADGRQLEGHIVGADLPTDVAVVAVEADGLTVAVLGRSDDLEVGAPTLALGVGRGLRNGPAVTTGVISALDRRLDLDGEALHGLIQTDAPIESAWSGGPLLDASGAVIGITTDLGGARTGFGFATPIDLVRAMADELMATGKVTHGWLGIEGTDLSESEAGPMGVPGGATIRKVMPGSPAAAGGLAAGDIITEVDGRAVTSSSDLVIAMRRHKPGAEVTIGYWRDDDHHQTTVTIDHQP